MTWHKLPDDENLLEDHYWYLIAHRRFGTPMKAKYHDDCDARFEFYCAEGRCSSYLTDNEVTHWMELPKKPEE